MAGFNKRHIGNIFILSISSFIFIIGSIILAKYIRQQKRIVSAKSYENQVLRTGIRNIWDIDSNKILNKGQSFYLRKYAEYPLALSDTTLKSKICLSISKAACNDCLIEVVSKLNYYFKKVDRNVIIAVNDIDANDIVKLLKIHGNNIPVISYCSNLIEQFDDSDISFPYLFFIDDQYNILHFMILDKNSLPLLDEYLSLKKHTR